MGFQTFLILGFPAVVCLWLCFVWWFRWTVPERVTARLVTGSFVGSALLSGLCLLMSQGAKVLSSWGVWYHLADYEYSWRIALDPLSLTMALLAATLLAVISAFSESYLHQEVGFRRFYLLTTLFGVGVLLILLSGSLEEIFFGWELVGLSSALLIAFFSHRVGPARSGLRAFLTYRVCDIGLLAALVMMHHLTGSAILSNAHGAWLGLRAPEDPRDSLIVVALLVFACMGKSALAPFGGWLPRAMEGPTPSSAVFYGALSIHLGPYLLLRAWPLLESSVAASAIVVVVGLVTAFHGTTVGRVQSDAKSALAYGAMTQVGIILIEIGLGFRWLAVLHIVGHACLRTLEILRSPSLLHDYHHIEKSLGEALPRMGMHYESSLPKSLQQWMYRNALERGFFEMYLGHLLALWTAFVRTLDGFERTLEDGLAGDREADKVISVQ